MVQLLWRSYVDRVPIRLVGRSTKHNGPFPGRGI